MTRSLNVIANVASRFSVQFLGACAIGPLLGWLVVAILPGRIDSPFATFLLTSFFGIFGVLLCTGAYLLNRDNRRLKDCAYDLHSINHIYRDALSTSFALADDSSTIPQDLLLDFERNTLKAVCEKISNLFSNLVGRKCVATVKLVVSDEDGSRFCFTWARSESNSHRETEPRMRFSILTGENTGFDKALEFRDDQPSHFFSPDLWIEGNYSNQRKGWQRLYRSTIVVPIRHVIDRKSAEVDLIGFLCVDTRTAYRLNDTYAVEYLAAFADQMYNFMSIVRESLPTKEDRSEISTGEETSKEVQHGDNSTTT